MKVKVYEKVAEVEIPPGATHYLPYYDQEPLTIFKISENECHYWDKHNNVWRHWRHGTSAMKPITATILIEE